MAGRATDVAIIGGGILGVILARLTAERGLRTALFRLRDRGRPSADTLRNQSWLQSGLRYVRQNKALALKMWTHGRRMHEFFGFQPPDGRGIIQVASEDDAGRLYEDAENLGIRPQIRQLAPNEASNLLGPLYLPAGIAFETPESPFEEAALLREARDTARAAGASLFELDDPVQILSLPGQTPSHRLLINGQELEARNTILAAGAGNIPLLSSLGSQITIDLQQTPLLVIPGAPLIQSPILLDRTADLSIIAHAPGTSRKDGCMVVGTSVKEDVQYCSVASRRILDSTRERVFRALPPCLQARFKDARFTAGWEPAPVVDGKRAPSSIPWIDSVEDHPDVLVSMPGRATLALHTAEQILAKIEQRSFTPATDKTVFSPAVDGWTSSVSMHHEETYDGLNDV